MVVCIMKKLLLCVFILLRVLYFHFCDYSIAIDASVCDEFFSGKKWAVPTSYANETGLVSLCQNRKGGQTAYFASLFSTKRRCPIYSANKVKLDPDAKIAKRPNNEQNLWKRFATTLCGDLPTVPVMSELQKDSNNEKCPILQASFDDYKQNTLVFNKGHLEPSSINGYEDERQKTTFTLTNACPQYVKFNGQEWATIECLTRQLITTLSPNKYVFVITGVEGNLKIANKIYFLNERVAAPDKYWKAVCYPGNGESDPAWGFSIIAANRDKEQPQLKAIKSKFKFLKAFVGKIFPKNNIPFSTACINAPLKRVKTALVNMTCNKENSE